MTAIFWRRLDTPGHEMSRVRRDGAGWLLSGHALFLHEGAPVSLGYEIACDEKWLTRRSGIAGSVGDRDVSIVVDCAAGAWRLNGVAMPRVAGCSDLDLAFSPSTNILPIRRLRLAVGQSAEVRSAWLRFPEFDLVTLAQTYTRHAPDTYSYDSAGTGYRGDLKVNETGFVTDYPELWIAESG